MIRNSRCLFLLALLAGSLGCAEIVAAQAPAESRTATPLAMTECEGTNNCASWTFLGTLGNGQWPSGEVANLSVETFDASTVVIRRADSTGAAAGLTAVYKGTRHDDRVGGEFTSSWPGHWENKSGNWYATIEKAAVAPPPVMKVCDPAGSCGTWTWNNGHYDGEWGQGGATATMTVVSFSPSSVVINRTDNGPRAGFAYVYKGKISPEGNSIVNGEWSGQPGSRQADGIGRFTATWGTALGNNPAQQAQQQQHMVVVRPVVVCYPWFFGVVCQ